MAIELGGGSMRLISGFDILGEWVGGSIDLANQRDVAIGRVRDVTIGGTVATEWDEDLLTLTTPQKQPRTQMTDEPTEELDRFFDSMVVRKD